MTSKTFKKYGSIPNHYNKKDWVKWLDKYPELQDEMYVIEEKIHGTNFQLFFNKNGEDYHIGSRNRILGNELDNDHFGIKFYFAEHEPIIQTFKDFALLLGKNVTVYGEFFGSSIQKNMGYGNIKTIRFFSMIIGGKHQSQHQFYLYMKELNLSDWVVKVLEDEIRGLDKALEYNEVFKSYYQIEEGDYHAEGIVIKPKFKPYINHNNEPFMIKKKSKWFREFAHEKVKKSGVIKYKFDIGLEHYVTPGRIQSVLSKFGEATIRDTGKIIKLTIEDVIKDYNSEHNLPVSVLSEDFEINTKKAVSMIVKTFHDELSK